MADSQSPVFDYLATEEEETETDPRPDYFERVASQSKFFYFIIFFFLGDHEKRQMAEAERRETLR